MWLQSGGNILGWPNTLPIIPASSDCRKRIGKPIPLNVLLDSGQFGRNSD
jgi:hypothetical protein